MNPMKNETGGRFREPLIKGSKWRLLFFDLLLYFASCWLILVAYSGNAQLTWKTRILQACLGLVCIFSMRIFAGIYRQIWRYGGIQSYIRLMITDGVAFLIYYVIGRFLPQEYQIVFARILSVSALCLLWSLAIRMGYRYAYKCGNRQSRFGRFLLGSLRVFGGFRHEPGSESQAVRVAIVGAGRTGVMLAEGLKNDASAYDPVCFIDIDRRKIGCQIRDVPVISDDENVFTRLRLMEVQEIIFAIPDADKEKKAALYERYLQSGCRLKVYDHPTVHTAGAKLQLREFDIEELLFRPALTVVNDKTKAYYRDKVILITGGGGSIGSEICRQLAAMSPKRIVILDIYENGAYDVQQELKLQYKNSVDVRIEIVSVTNRSAMDRVFATHRPQIVINAAAHKHVPLMEHNCIEAIENNVFGCKVLVDLCEQYGAERFMMVSTDKAVNPTNVMGATKRMCEMIVQSASAGGRVRYSCTRFGNVLGSAGSVIPLFRKQIANGGPVTVTDRQITRYFMTIPEASQLVLISGAMADNGELFVLDMGQPVKIWDLAENMIRLSGVSGIEIVETGLRPGEKLYEELLIRSETLTKTENDLIFIEKDTALSPEEIRDKLAALRSACESGNEDQAREALKRAVPTYREAEKN